MAKKEPPRLPLSHANTANGETMHHTIANSKTGTVYPAKAETILKWTASSKNLDPTIPDEAPAALEGTAGTKGTGTAAAQDPENQKTRRPS